MQDSNFKIKLQYVILDKPEENLNCEMGTSALNTRMGYE